MLQTIKRWFTSAPSPGWSDVEAWALERHSEFKRSRDGDGFVVESGTPHAGWRLEWGPSQRPYIAGGELRLRGEAGSGDLPMVLLSRQLMEAMEKAVFESFTEDLQTRVDSGTPEEMRWLVMFPKLPAAELKALREDFGAAGAHPQWLGPWIEGPLAQALQQARASWLAAEDPLALIVQHGRLTMRTAMPQPDAARLGAALALFETALREARRVMQAWHEHGMASTMPALWTDSGGGPRTR